MGTFACYDGNMNISEEEREDFVNQMLKILNFGGMLQFETVNIYGKKVLLIKPPEVDKDGKVEFHYNYFEDEPWESAYFDTNEAYLSSGKIGCNEFNWAISAAYSLYEAYNESAGTVTQNGDAINSGESIGWINCVLGTSFTIRNRYRLWEYFESKGLSDYKNGYQSNIKMSDVVNRVPSIFYKGLGGVELADICNILEGTSALELEEAILSKDSYPEVVLRVKKALSKYYGSKDNNDVKKERLFALLKMEREKRAAYKNTELKELAELSLCVSARVFIYLSAELLEQNFWGMWDGLVKDVYRDEDCSSYATERLRDKREKIRNTIMPNVSTVDYFYNDGYFTFWDTPEELKRMPNYYITKDECAYWWDGEDEYFSEAMQKWLEELAARHRKIAENMNLSEVKREDFLKMMIDTLDEVNTYYRRVFAYRDMFYEFLLLAENRDVYAAIILLKELSDENKEAGKIIGKLKGSWELGSKNVTFNIGRRRMKRYLAVMANKKLRKKYFGF